MHGIQDSHFSRTQASTEGTSIRCAIWQSCCTQQVMGGGLGQYGILDTDPTWSLIQGNAQSLKACDPCRFSH